MAPHTATTVRRLQQLQWQEPHDSGTRGVRNAYYPRWCRKFLRAAPYHRTSSRRPFDDAPTNDAGVRPAAARCSSHEQYRQVMTPAYVPSHHGPAGSARCGATSDYYQPKQDIATRSYSVQYTPRYIPSAPSIPDGIPSPRSPAYIPVTSSNSWNNNSNNIDNTRANSGLQTPKYYHSSSSSSSTLVPGHKNSFSNNTSRNITRPTSSAGKRQHKAPPRKRKANHHQRKVRFHRDAGKDTNKKGHPSK